MRKRTERKDDDEIQQSEQQLNEEQITYIVKSEDKERENFLIEHPINEKRVEG